MTPLRQQMTDAMTQRGFSPRTHEAYLANITDLARYTHCSPDQVSPVQLADYFRHLAVERKLSGSSCRQQLCAVRFLYRDVLKRRFDIPLAVPKKAQRIPELLTRQDVARLLRACDNPKHRMMLATCYGAGLRVSEVVALQVRHVDGEQRLLRIEQGKGAKDRLVPIGEALLHQLRGYWQQYRPVLWLFPSRHPNQPLTVSTPQRAFRKAVTRAGIRKQGGIHALRHAYATHQLAAGMPIHTLKEILGHQDLHSTERYLHWVPGAAGNRPITDLLETIDHCAR